MNDKYNGGGSMIMIKYFYDSQLRISVFDKKVNEEGDNYYLFLIFFC